MILFQKWPRTDIGPIEALLMIFAYEKRTGDTVSITEMKDGTLGSKLLPCDFQAATEVTTYTLHSLQFNKDGVHG